MRLYLWTHTSQLVQRWSSVYVPKYPSGNCDAIRARTMRSICVFSRGSWVLRQVLQPAIPVLQHRFERSGKLRFVALGRAFRLCGMRDRCDRHGSRLALGSGLPQLPGFGGQGAECHHRLNLLCGEEGLEPAMAVGNQLGVLAHRHRYTAIYAVDEGIDEDIATSDPELRQEALQSSTRLSHQDAADDTLVLGRVLTDDHHAGGAVQPSPMKNRSPFDAEACRRLDICARVVGTQSP